MPNLALLFMEGRRGTIEFDNPSLSNLYSNAIELWRFRSILERTLEEKVALEEIYRNQCIKFGRDNTELRAAN